MGKYIKNGREKAIIALSFRLQRQREKPNYRVSSYTVLRRTLACPKAALKALSFELLSATLKHAAEIERSSTPWNNKGVARRGIPCYAAKGA